MTLRSLRRSVVQRLDEAPRGDHGWSLLTRVHLNAGRLRSLAAYLYDVGFESAQALSDSDYRALAHAAEVDSPEPGVTLRRHYFLAMSTPLRLLERSDGRSWDRIQLTSIGQHLALDPDTGAVLEHVLQEIRFCQEPWFTAQKASVFSDFNVRPYEIALEVMAAADGWVDRDEYDLFLSRVREPDETPAAIDGIAQFRDLPPDERQELLDEVRTRVPGAKAHQNWRDTALHTFSLFSLGKSAVRLQQRLILSTSAALDSLGEEDSSGEPGRQLRRSAQRLRLQIPSDPEGAGKPPVAPAANVGTDGELLVSKLLEADGWTVVFYSNRRGFGFDLWAARGDQTMVVEVKSSVTKLSTVSLTRLEFEAAAEYGTNFVLALVEDIVSSDVSVSFVVDPASRLPLTEVSTVEFVTPRSAWLPAAIADL